MPATEQTWRNTTLLHKVFAVSSMIMLGATIWMFVKDHSRPWKPYQRTANKIEMVMTDWRELQYETDQAVSTHKQLVAAVEDARRQAIDWSLIDQFSATVKEHEETEAYVSQLERLRSEVEQLSAQAGTAEAETLRQRVLDTLNGIVAHVRTSEETMLGRLKFARADRDAAVAEVGIALRDNKPELMKSTQNEVDEIKADVDQKQQAYDALKSQRERLQAIVKQITSAEDAADEALGKNESNLSQLRDANVERRSTYVNWYGPIPLPGKKWLELPILDAFNSPLKIDNLWSEGLVIDYNFSKVRRFDRCTTCHRSIQKTAPGSASEPAYPHSQLIDFVLLPPEISPDVEVPTQPAEELEMYYGLMLATEGLLRPTDVTVQFVRPESPAARAEALRPDAAAMLTGEEIRERLLTTRETEEEVVLPGLNVGDVIERIDGDPVHDVNKVMFRLVDAAKAGQSLRLTVRRGVPHPYASHPRLDLYVGSLSPHKISEFACTICHEGQGSATAFKWASHMPNSEVQRKEWAREHGWFDNPHWIFPMYQKRFAEAACLKCHHEVTELEPSERFPDPPAPKVVRGFNLVRKYGCFGCHEIGGFDGPERVGPDLRLEPNYFAAALQLRAEPGFDQLPPEAQGWAQELAEHPERASVRRRLYEILLADGSAEQPVLPPRVHSNLVPLFKDIENPGTLRKVGPSLRFASHKLDTEFTFDWIREPKHFRPTTRMPQFFGLWGAVIGHGDISEQFEPLEVLGVTEFLMRRSQQYEYLTPPEGVEPASADRGKVLFEERGCLACHSHRDFSDAEAYRAQDEILQGPDLSAIGSKFDPQRNPNGPKWLYSWIKQPTRYHARTVMPDLFLNPIQNTEGQKTDPAADIVAFLMGSVSDWQPAAGTLSSLDEVNPAVLDELVLENLKDAFSEAASKRYIQQGIPSELRPELKGAEVELLQDAEGAIQNGQLSMDAKLLYVGRRTISKYGCYGCHDIPGFEDAKPIGTSLADWGRKESSKLAFEHITHYIEDHLHGEGHGDESHSAGEESHSAGEFADDGETQEMREFYLHQIESGHRAGFIYQKLLAPRSFDYHKTENKKYNERLRMPQFPLSAQQREDTITFVLGLVADPPAEKYIYRPDERTAAIIAGKQVLDKYNCAGCHLLEGKRWQIAFDPGTFGEQPSTTAFPFVHPHFTPRQIEESLEADASGLLRARVEGMPALNDAGAPLVYHQDDPGFELEADERFRVDGLEYPIDLWRPVPLEGHGFEVGILPLNVRSSQIERRYNTHGGFLAKYLLPRVVAREKQVNPAAKGTEAWGWLPPPLIGQGSKVQTDWLHEFLLNPHPIRPAVVLRMPRFNMSPEESTRLVHYFAAIDNAEYPYNAAERQQRSYLAAAEAAYERKSSAEGNGPVSSRFTDAMRIITNNNYCVKCHLVGDFVPQGSERAKAPNLAEVHRRLRADFLRQWIANPKSILPYTSMPVNIPYDPQAVDFRPAPNQPVLYHGTSTETVDALVDLLLNFDQYTKQRSPITPLVSGAAPADAVSAVVPAPVSQPAATPAPAPSTPPATVAPKPAPPPAPMPNVPAATAKPLPDSLKNLPQASGWGDLKVRFAYDGTAPRPGPVRVTKDEAFCGQFNLVDESLVVNPENGGVANVVATLYQGRDAKPMPIHESYLEHARDQVVLDNDHCRFEPRVTLLWTTQPLMIKNSDAVGHNTKIDTLTNPAVNSTIPAGGFTSLEFSRPERTPASPVACSIHPWMNGWLVIRDNPYSSVSDKDGVLEIKNLPEGTWTIQFWHEKPGYVADVSVAGKKTNWQRGRLEVSIKDGQTTDLGEVRFVP